MKAIKFTLTALAVVLALAACRKLPRTIQDIDDPDPAPAQEPALPGAPQELHACRVQVTTPASPLSEISFSEGGLYWILFKSEPALCGVYTYSDDSYIMEGFGKVRFKGTSGTKAGGYEELPDTIVITDEDGNETVYDCTIYKNQDPNILFRAWKVKTAYISVGESDNITLSTLDVKKLFQQLSSKGIAISDENVACVLESIDIAGTGEFTATYKISSKQTGTLKANWKDRDDNFFYLNWEETDLEFLKRSEDAPAIEISYGFDATQGLLGLGLSFSMKTTKGADCDVSFLIMFEPKK